MSNITSSGFKYRADSLGVSSSSIITAFDFTNNPSTNGGFINPAFWSSGSYSGKLNGNNASFSQKPGSGYFLASNSIDVMGSIPSDNFSAASSYVKHS